MIPLEKKKKKKHKLKVENYVLFSRLAEDLSLGETASQERSQDIQEFLKNKQTKIGNRNFKRLQLIKEKQTSQVNKLSAFLCMGRCQESELIEIIPLRGTLTIQG